jgi:hypothetical protein
VTEEHKPVLLGELLTRAGILTAEMLEDALQRSKETRLPLGKIVTWSGYITDTQLHAAIEAQSLINDHLLNLEVGVNALKLVLNRSHSFDNALDSLGWTPGEVFQRNRLGDLLTAADMVSQEQLQEALTASSSTSLPLGQVLTCMPNHGLYVQAGLNAQALIREGKVGRQKAIEALVLVREHGVNFEQALLELGIREASLISSMELSELLMSAGVFTQAQMMQAMEKSLDQDLPLSKCLIDLSLLSADSLHAARQLRAAIASGEITRAIGIDAMRLVHQDSFSAEQAIAAASDKAACAMPKISALDLLRLAALVTAEDVRKMIPQEQTELAHALATDTPSRLLTENAIDEESFRTLLECLQLLERNTINLQQAIVVLHICLRGKLPLAEALNKISIRVT